MSDPLVREIGDAVASLPDGALDALEHAFRADLPDSTIISATATATFRERARALIAARDNASAENSAVGLALAAARDRERAARSQQVSVVWTGPETSAVPTRRTEQALLELIAATRERLIVVSFAVYKVPEVASALVVCAQRGCEVAVVVESESESEGKVKFDMAQALGSEVARHATLYTWPREGRPDVGNGRLASLHAKCAVADGERLLISSANFTEYAFTKNIELGLLVEGGDVPRRVQMHLESLISDRLLRPIAPKL